MYNIIKNDVTFEWDKDKNKLNQKKHGISFEKAVKVFYDENAILFDDPDHSFQEERFLIMGLSGSNEIYIVSHCYRSKGEVIRIISARRATKNERNTYYRKRWSL